MRARISTALLVFSLIVFHYPPLLLSATKYDTYFEEAMKSAAEGNVDAAVASFAKASKEDPAAIDPYLNIGVCYQQAGQIQKAIEAYGRAAAVFPDDWRPYYQLVACYGYTGEIAKALENYARAEKIGIKGDDPLRRLLAQYAPREFTVAYEPLGGGAGSGTVDIAVTGNPSGDEQIVKDVIRQLEKMEAADGKSLFRGVSVAFIRWIKPNTLATERWTVSGPGREKAYWVTLDFAPPPDAPSRVMITVSDRE